MTLNQLLNEGSRKLRQVKNPDAELDARQLLLAAFHLDQVHFLMNRMQPLGGDEHIASSVALYRSMIKKRCRRIPLQQILGCQDFMGMTFYVNKHVLIPRQDTETLVELILKENPNHQRSVLDMGTGSGCIAVSLAALGGYESVSAVDISAEALKVAKKNAENLVAQWEQRMCFLHGDLFSVFDGREEIQFDIIVSNPPYIPSSVIPTLEPEVREHEPLQALDGAQDGLFYYRKIAAKALVYGKAGGALYLEIGHDQGEAVSRILDHCGYEGIEVFKDLPGKDRVVRAYLPESEGV